MLPPLFYMGSPCTGQRSQTYGGPGVLRISLFRSEAYVSFLSEFSAPLSTLELLKREYSPEDLETYIGTPLFQCFLFRSILACILVLSAYSHIDLFLCTNMRLSKDKKKKLADLLAKKRTASRHPLPLRHRRPLLLILPIQPLPPLTLEG